MQPYAELATRVIKWSEQRGLLDTGDENQQFKKFIEEVGELAWALAHTDLDAAENAIGDILVTLINVSEILGINTEEALAKVVLEIEARSGTTRNGVFIKDDDTTNGGGML